MLSELANVAKFVLQDRHLNTFLRAFQSLSIPPKKKSEQVSESDLISTIKGVIKARPEPMVAFLYVVIDRLLALIVSPPYSGDLSISLYL